MVRITPSSSQIGKIFYATLNGLAAALAAAGSNGHVVVADAQAVTTALTVPAGATLEVKQGGLLTFSGSGALAVNGTFQAGLYQVFAGGSPTFVAGSIEAARPEWWGGKGDWNGTTGTDNRVAFDRMLASGAQKFQLARGNYGFATADANGNAVTISIVGAEFLGSGYGLTTITPTCAVTWGVKATVAQVRCRGFTLQVGPGGSATYGVGVSTAAVGSAESCAFVDILEGVTGGGTVVNGFAVGPDNPGVTTMDIAETSFLRCRANGPHSNAAYILGNGTGGNILCTQLLHCVGINAVYGLRAQHTGFTFTDGTLEHNTGWDLSVDACNTDTIKVDGLRSETSAGFWTCGGTSVAMNVSIRNVEFTALSLQASGIWVNHSAGGVLTMESVSCVNSGAIAPIIQFKPQSPTNLSATLVGVAQAATPSAGIVVGGGGFGGAAVTVTAYQQLDASGNFVAAWPFDMLGTLTDWQHQVRRKVQSVAYAATITPDAALGDVLVGTLTGNIAVANPANGLAGQFLTLQFVQDATGGRTISFGTHMKASWTGNTTLNTRNVITFWCADGTTWIQTASATGLPL